VNAVNAAHLFEKRYVSDLPKILILFAVYFLTAKLGLMLDPVSGFATLVWPPTGIALAALLIFGYHLWPGVLGGAFLVNFLSGAPLAAACGMGLGNTGEALLGAYLLQRLPNFQNSLESVRNVIALIVLAAFLSTMLSATVGVSSLRLGGVLSLGSFAPTWWAWWIGDMLGDLIMAPFLLVWSSQQKIAFRWKKTLEGLMLALVAIAVSWLVFFPYSGLQLQRAPITYFLLLPLVWAALRFGPRGTVTVTFFMSIFAIWATSLGFGPFVRAQVSESLMFLQIFMGAVSVTSLILAATVSERERAESDLRAANERLRRLDEQKSQFMALASHELQTPLTSVGGFVNLFLRGRIGALTDEQKSYLTMMQDVIGRLQRMVDDLLDITRIELGQIQMNKRSTDLKKLLGEAVIAFKVQADAKEILIEEEIEEALPEILCDGDRMGEILDNLISNALKYTPRNGRIWVRARNLGAAVQIDVQDTGIGIKKEDQDRIFEPFQHIKKTGLEGEKSVGLGLALVKAIIEAHQGEIMLQSETGRGSTFSVRLPVNPS
jgi:signal transduction histidine kinase